MVRRVKTRAKSKRQDKNELGRSSMPAFPLALDCKGGAASNGIGSRSTRMENYNRQRMIAAATRSPLDFRRGHGPLSDNSTSTVEQLNRSIPDADGGIGLPHRAHDTLAVLLRNGTIRDQEHDAGRRFEEDFALACLDPLHASDPGRIPGRRQLELNDAIIAGRSKIRATMATLGGPTTPVGSSVWCVLGLGQTLKEWAVNCQFGQGGRSLDERVAKGIFLAALSVLALHYGTTRRTPAGG